MSIYILLYKDRGFTVLPDEGHRPQGKNRNVDCEADSERSHAPDENCGLNRRKNGQSPFNGISRSSSKGIREEGVVAEGEMIGNERGLISESIV